MKTLIRFLIASLVVLTASASDRITAILTVTNLPATGNYITVNSTSRYWSNATPTTAWLLTNATIGGSATNLYTNALVAAYSGTTSGTTAAMTDTNVVTLTGYPGDALAVTVSGSWASVSYSTQTLASTYTIRVPGSAEAVAYRTNNYSLLVTALNDYSSNALSATATVTSTLMNLSTAQTNTGSKTFGGTTTVSNVAVLAGYATNVYLRNAVISYSNPSTNGSGIAFQNSSSNTLSYLRPDSAGYPALYDTNRVALDIASPTDAMVLNYATALNVFGGLTASNAWTGTNTFSRITNSTWVNGTITNASVLGGTLYTNTFVNATVTGNLGIGASALAVPTSLNNGLYITNGTAPTADPANGFVMWSTSGSPMYRGNGDGSGNARYMHNTATQTVGTGSNYTFPDTAYHRVDFSGSDPECTVPTAGTYLIICDVSITAGVYASDAFVVKLYNSTAAADISYSERTLSTLIENSTGHVTTTMVVTLGSASTIQLYAANATAARGRVNATETTIMYVRLY